MTSSELSGEIKGYGLRLRRVEIRDLPCLRRWRNQPTIRDQMLDTKYISPKRQIAWYQQIRSNDHEAHWVALYSDIKVGYMNVKGDGPLSLQKTLGGGLYIGNSKVKHGLLGYSLALLQLEIVFEYLGVPEYRTSFRRTNVSARKFNQQLGYKEVGCEDDFIWLSITKRGHAVARKKILRYFSNDRKANVEAGE